MFNVTAMYNSEIEPYSKKADIVIFEGDNLELLGCIPMESIKSNRRKQR